MDDIFEWDPDKAETNLKKHDVSFEEGATVFADPLSLTISDPLHSSAENRFITLGMSIKQQILVVVHADRNNKIRIISARRVTPGERRKYADETE